MDAPDAPTAEVSDDRQPSTVAQKINFVAIPVGIATALMAIQDVDSPVRVWFTVALFLFGAGSGLTRFLRIPDGALQTGVVIALSLTIDILVGQTLLSVHNISESAGACILAGFTCIRPLARHAQSNEAEPSKSNTVPVEATTVQPDDETQSDNNNQSEIVEDQVQNVDEPADRVASDASKPGEEE